MNIMTLSVISYVLLAHGESENRFEGDQQLKIRCISNFFKLENVVSQAIASGESVLADSQMCTNLGRHH